jgi:hypothetical protein
MKARPIVAAAFILLFAFAPKPTTLTPPSDPVPASFFGMHIHHMVSLHGTDRLTPWPSVPVPEWRLWDARVTWPDLEPSKGQWHFEDLDRSLALAEAHHTDVLLTLGLTPRWASARPEEPSGYEPGYAAEPKDLEDWRAFVRTVATRYKGRIHAYEIWNEPNVRKFWTGSLDQLVTLTREASVIIHSIDPQALVVSPPATGFPGVKWLPEFLSKAGQYVDVVGYHFYVTPREPEIMLPLIAAIERIMAANGAGSKPLWCTELGWLPPFRADSDELAAAFLARSYLLAWAAGVQRLYWFSWDAHKGLGLETTEQDSQTLRPAGRAFNIIQEWLVGKRVDWCNADEENNWKCQLSQSGKLEWIVWNPSGTKTFAVPNAWHARSSTSLFDTKRKLTAPTIDAGPVPVLIATSDAK